MKKTYQKPEALVELIELEQLMGASIIEGVEADKDATVLGREFPIFETIEFEE